MEFTAKCCTAGNMVVVYICPKDVYRETTVLMTRRLDFASIVTTTSDWLRDPVSLLISGFRGFSEINRLVPEAKYNARCVRFSSYPSDL